MIDRYDLNGNYLGRLIDNTAGGALAGPWSMAIAPINFGQFGGDLLVSNNDNGTIAALNPTTGAFLGDLTDANGKTIVNTGIWSIEFGTSIRNGNPNALYLFAGINGEKDGLMAELTAVPEPGSLTLLAIGVTSALAFQWRRSASKQS